jgi:peptide methionine sulfoxide reductase msrA/msrB
MKKILITIVLGLVVLAGCAAPSITKDATMEKADDMTEEKIKKEEMTDSTSNTNEGTQSPSFIYTDFDGNEVKLTDFEGKKVYIKYWASWCPICLSGLERLDQLFEGVDEDSDYKILTVVTPGYNNEGSEEEFKKWFSGLEYENIEVLFDNDGEFAKKFNVRAVPTSVFIGSDGVIISSLAGDKSNEDIMATLESFN